MSDTAIAHSPWLAVFDQDIPARVLSAVSYGTGFVILSLPSGMGGQADVVPEEFSAILSRLHEASLTLTTLTAPLPRLPVVQHAISDAMAASLSSRQLLVVVIRHAEALSDATVRRLIRLSELRRHGQPVLSFLLAGTPSLWPVLHGAGLGHLENDPTAHIRLTRSQIEPGLAAAPPAFAANAADPISPPVRPDPYRLGSSAYGREGAGRLRGSLAGHGMARVRFAPTRSALVRFALAGAGLAGIGLAGWHMLAPGLARPEHLAIAGDPPAIATSVDMRFAALIDQEKKEIASDRLSSPSGANLIETRRQIDELLPLVSRQLLDSLTNTSARADADNAKHLADRPQVSRQPAVSHGAGDAAVDPLGNLIHVTLRYSRGDKAAEARARHLLELLRSRGIMADGPEPAGAIIERSGLAYYFDQDRTAALDLARRLLAGIPQTRKPMTIGGLSDAASLPRPGEISISIGSRDDVIEAPAPSGRRT